MATDLSAAQYTLREDILPVIQSQLNNSTVLLKLVKRTARNIVSRGRNLYGYIHVLKARNQGIGARAESAALPTAGNRSYDRMYVPMTYQYGSIRITGPTFEAAKSKDALVNIVLDETEGMTEGLTLDIGRQFVGDGSGALARVSSRSTDTITIYRNALSPGTKHLEAGMVVDSYDAKSSGTIGWNSVTIESVDSDTQITLSADPSSDQDSDYLFREDSVGKELVGLAGHVDDGNTFVSTWQSVVRSTSPWAKAIVKSNSSTVRDITLDLLQQVVDEIEMAGGYPNVIYGTHKSRREYLGLLTGDRRFPAKPTVLDGGFTGLEYTGGSRPIVWYADRHAIPGRLFVIDTSDLIMFEAMKPQWLSDRTLSGASAGGPLQKVSGYDYYDANLGWYIALGGKRCNRSGRVDDLDTTI